MHRAPLRLVFLVTIAAMSSCAAPVIVATAGLTAVEAGTSAYIRGVLEASERATMDEMWYSVTQTLRVLQYPVLQADRYDQTCYFAGKADNGMTITVRLERSSPVVTNRCHS
jgi:hypothetical protein